MRIDNSVHDRDIEKWPQPDGSAPSPRLASGEHVAGSNKETRSQLGDESPITTYYLTFQTDLPAPNIAALGDSERSRLPAPPNLLQFTSPLEWPELRKNIMLVLSCMATFLAAYSAGAYSPPAAIMAADLGSSQVPMLAGITTFCVGFALCPMALAPLSELYGRYPVFIFSGIIYVAFQAVCSVAPNLTVMLLARFLVGAGGSVFSSVIGGVIADLWTKEQRNTPMALFSGAVLAGTGAGPLTAAIMVKQMAWYNRSLAWKWVFWHQVIADSILFGALVVLFKESRGSVLLSRKAKALNTWYRSLEALGCYGVWIVGEVQIECDDDCEVDASMSESDTSQEFSLVGGEEKSPESTTGTASACPRHHLTSQQTLNLQRIRWAVKEDAERASLPKMISTSIVRPFKLLFTEPVVFFFSLWCAFAWAVLYCTFGSIPIALYRMRNMDIEQSGYFFTAVIIGSCVATSVGIWQERLLRLPQWKADASVVDCPGRDSRFWIFMRRQFPAEAPESRLYFTCITATLLPGGLYLFGFTAQPQYHWIAPAFGIAMSTWGIFSVYLATFNYFADIYHKYASSALAAQSFCRNILGGVFPLFTGALFSNLGERRAGTLLGTIALGLTIIPWVLVFYGAKIRGRSKFAISLELQG